VSDITFYHLGRLADEFVSAVHRLTAAFALAIYLSPCFEEEVTPLLEVLQAKETLLSKLDPEMFGGKGVSKKEVKELIQEVATKLCP
jgi:desumoylating isopeptidase 1